MTMLIAQQAAAAQIKASALHTSKGEKEKEVINLSILQVGFVSKIWMI